jgi:hypothetical protein
LTCDDAWRCSSSASSDLVFLLAAVLAVLAVRDDERGPLAFAAEAVTVLAGLDDADDLDADDDDDDAASGSLVAALALVRRFGGERIASAGRLVVISFSYV